VTPVTPLNWGDWRGERAVLAGAACRGVVICVVHRPSSSARADLRLTRSLVRCCANDMRCRKKCRRTCGGCSRNLMNRELGSRRRSHASVPSEPPRTTASRGNGNGAAKDIVNVVSNNSVPDIRNPQLTCCRKEPRARYALKIQAVASACRLFCPGGGGVGVRGAFHPNSC
jgi:hypothetical protein